MAEWSVAHAWKAISARLTKQHGNTSSRNQFNDLPLCNAPRCDTVNVGVRRRFRAHLTQFLHSSRLQLVERSLAERRYNSMSVARPLVRCELSRMSTRVSRVSERESSGVGRRAATPTRASGETHQARPFPPTWRTMDRKNIEAGSASVRMCQSCKIVIAGSSNGGLYTAIGREDTNCFAMLPGSIVT
jgi:hypothetical protein